MKSMSFFYIVALVLIVGCQRKSGLQSEKKIFRYNESSGITSLDPAYANNQANIWACHQLFNGLVQLNKRLEPSPCIAKSWEILNEGRTYRFHLRTDVFFHSNPALQEGRKVTAHDFVYSFSRICHPKTASPGAWVFEGVRKGSDSIPDGFTALDDSTLEIHLSVSYPPFLGLLASAYCAVVPKEAVNFFGQDFRKNPVGTGPFKFYQWLERTALIYHRNDRYFEIDAQQRRLPYLDAVFISFISDKQSAFLEFLKGKLDMISGIDASYKDDLLTNKGTLKPKYQGRFKMETAPYLNTEYLGILMDSTLPAMKSNPLKDIRIRQALNYGFDRKKMIRFLRNGMATPGTGGMIPLGMPGFDSLPVKGYDYDPVLAKKLLEEAGYPSGAGLPEITMSTTHSYQDICEFLQGQLSESGFNIRLEVNQAAQHRQMVSKQQLAFFRGSWIADYADAENYLSLFRSVNKAPAGPNYTHFSNAAFDETFETAMGINDPVKRTAVYRQLDSMAMAASPVIVLYYDKVVRLTQHRLQGLEMNAMNLLELKNVDLKD